MQSASIDLVETRFLNSLAGVGLVPQDAPAKVDWNYSDIQRCKSSIQGGYDVLDEDISFPLGVDESGGNEEMNVLPLSDFV